MRWRRLVVGAVIGAATVAAMAALRSSTSRPKRSLIFMGTQATGKGEGVFAAWLDEDSGALTPIGWVAEVERPTWLHADRARKRLFAVSEVGNDGTRDGAVLSFRYDAETGALTSVVRTSSGGGGATHLDMDAMGKVLFVANFGGGSVGAIPVAENGALGSVRSLQKHDGSGPHRRQPGPRPHGVTLDPSGRFLLAPDMGADKLYVYRFDAEAVKLAPADPPFASLPAGSGARLTLFGQSGQFVYLLSELSAELFVFRWVDGALEQVQQIALGSSGASTHSAAALAISVDGRFLYASNRVANTAQVYAIDRRTGELTEIQRIAAGGSKPWGFALSPSGKWLLVANQASDNVCAFRVNRVNGRLMAMEGLVEVPSPTGVAFG